MAGAVAGHRRVLAALLAGLAALLALHTLRPGNVGVATLTAVRDLRAGAVLTAADFGSTPLRSRPDGAVARLPDGAILAAPLRRGEALTDVRLLGPALLESYGAAQPSIPGVL
ncbi:SAF domain-containing protein, partial [Actinocorallia lasiicapitis]